MILSNNWTRMPQLNEAQVAVVMLCENMKTLRLLKYGDQPVAGQYFTSHSSLKNAY